jgi:hypothetical protein
LGFKADVQAVDAAFPPAGPMPRELTYDEAKQVIIKTSKGERFVGQMTVEELNKVIEKSIIPANVEAARVVLAHDYQMTEPESEHPADGKLL